MKQKLYWISPLSHHVYKWWLFFFHTFFDLEVYDNSNICFNFWKQHQLQVRKSIDISKWNFLNIYNNKIKYWKKDIVIIWDIFTNTLCLTIRGDNVIYYSEFFLRKEDSLLKKVFAYIYSLWWYNKKILVPTHKSFDFFSKLSNRVTYFPEIYHGELYLNTTLSENKLKILFVWKLWEYKKNLEFLLSTLASLRHRINFEIWLCGQMEGYDDRLDYYIWVFWKDLQYYGFQDRKELVNIYTSYNVFILPSISDPIWAVVLEAMACSLPILVSDNVWASTYVQDGENGYIFRSNDQNDFVTKLMYLTDQNTRELFWRKSYSIVKEKFYYKNTKVLEKYYESITDSKHG